MTFEEYVKAASKNYAQSGYMDALGNCVSALEALAAERAEARSEPCKASSAPIRFWPPDTAYHRAMTAPRMGGQHPHDGRHIMSMRHWGMVG